MEPNFTIRKISQDQGVSLGHTLLFAGATVAALFALDLLSDNEEE